MNSNELKLLVTDKYYRWAKLEKLKLKIVSLPGIKRIIVLYGEYKMYKKMKGMDNWEKYVAMKNFEYNSQKYRFCMALLRLEVAIMVDNIDKELFYQAKEDVLSNDIINEPNLKEFKQWLIEIDHNETDYSKVQEVINSFTNTK